MLSEVREKKILKLNIIITRAKTFIKNDKRCRFAWT